MENKEKFKRVIWSVWIIAGIIIICEICFIIYKKRSDITLGTPAIYVEEYGDNMSRKERALVLKVEEDKLYIMRLENGAGSFAGVKFAKEGNIGFRMGQEILIYHSGRYETKNYMIYNDVGKIEIIAEKSDVSIPHGAMNTFYNTYDNVKIAIDEITKSEITFTITDNNEYLYDYSKGYRIYKKGQKAPPAQIIEDGKGGMATSGYARYSKCIRV